MPSRSRLIGATLSCALAIAFLSIPSFADARSKRKPTRPRPPVAFSELWGFVMKGEEHVITGDEPLSDICFFGVAPEKSGSLRGARDFPSFPANRRGIAQRVHLVVFDISNGGLMKSVLNPTAPERDVLVKEIAAASAPFAGVMIDFEAVPPDMRAPFIEFLTRLRSSLPKNSILSVALPARRMQVNDAYDYPAISAIVDRVFIMAYDQHWSTSKPGPVAAIGWCDAVAAFAQKNVPESKLVMGLPLYGRVWQDRYLGRSVRHSDVESILKRKRRLKPRIHHDRGPSLSYRETIHVTIYYEDKDSIARRLAMYQRRGIGQVGFWRIGQGPRGMWSLMELKPI